MITTGYSYGAKDIELQVSTEQSSYNRQESHWLKVQAFQAQNTTNPQKMEVTSLDQNTKRSKYWRFIIKSGHDSRYGLCVNDLKLNIIG